MAVPISIDSITEDTRALVCNVCSLKPNKTQFNNNPDLIECFEVDDIQNNVYVPLGCWKHFFSEFPYTYDQYDSTKMECTKTLYTIDTDPKGFRDQDVVAEEAYARLMAENTVFISASPGYGKTTLGNYLGCRLGLKTLVTCHVSKVVNQWVDEFRQHSTAKVQLVTGSKPLDPTADVYVIGTRKLANMTRSDFDGINIGTIIFDEAHIATITAFSQSLLRICPLYVIGLSATPERSDGMQKLLTMYFGSKRSFIHRLEVKDFVVYKYETDFKPELNYLIINGQAVPDWTTVINSLAYNQERQAQIADIIEWHPDDRVMILSDRTAECDALYSILSEKYGTTPDHEGGGVYLMDDSNKKDKISVIQSYRILIAGRKRAGVGFDDPTRTVMVLCTDCKDVRQNEGRLRTVGCTIYDMVDNFSTLEKHWDLREKWYLTKGAQIEVIHRKEKVVFGSKGKTGATGFKRRLLSPSSGRIK